MKAQIGKFHVEVITKARDQFAGNPIAVIRVNGKLYEAFRQATLSFWAFPLRPQMSNEECRQLDKFLDGDEEHWVPEMEDPNWKPEV